MMGNAFPAYFLTSKDILSMTDKHHFCPCIFWFSDKVHKIQSPKSVHKSCSISVIYSQSNKLIFCTFHFSFTQLHEMLPLSSNNEVKQNPSISKQHLPLFDTCSYFAFLVSFNQYISTLALLFYFTFTFTFVLVRLFGHFFAMCYTFQTDDYKTAR